MTSWIVKKQYRNVFMSSSFKSLVHHYSLHKLRFNFFFCNNKYNAGLYQLGTWKVQFRCYFQHHLKVLTFTPMPYELLFFLLLYPDHCMSLLLR
jgi:hypothetical protein